MEPDNVFLNKLPIIAATDSGDGTWNHYAFLESTWGERKILLKIIVFSSLYNTPLSFVSEIDHDVLQQTAMRLERTLEEFLHETKLALCTEGGANGFSYAVEENNFVWRKVLGPQLTVTYGSVTLLRSQCLLSDVLSNSIHTQNRLRADVQLKNKVLLELKDEHEELLELQRQQEEDTRLYEIELITKCISILNEKKEVINHLKKQLAEDEDEVVDSEEQTDGQQQPDQDQHNPTVEDEEQPLLPSDLRSEKRNVSAAAATVSRPPAINYLDSESSFPEPESGEELEDPEQEHVILPKRTKYQQQQSTHTAVHSEFEPATSGTSAASTSTATRQQLVSSPVDEAANDDDIYNKNTEELLQEI
uniref:XRCC4 N-terminal domain-containing protein n=1 Tax=Anopheles triannulatus TaxID=58253 RepID=A0A2M4AU38_9DIPT